MYLFPYDDNWQLEYQAESTALLEAFTGNITLHHIGSTAVEGLYAKNCIDILGVVDDISMIVKEVDNIVSLGYVYKGEYGITGRRYFSKAERKAHLHIFQKESSEVAKHLNFVKILNSNASLVQELNRLKISLHKKHPDNKTHYQREKASFYHKINEMALQVT